jgi:RHS repeat-associated protein
LTWERRYDTGLLAQGSTTIGVGWTTRYFATLTQAAGEFRFHTPEGGIEKFADPDNATDRGGVIRNLGTYQELERRDDRFVITRWNVDNANIERYVFREADPGIPLPLERIENATGQGLDLLRDERGRLTGIRQRPEQGILLVEYGAADRIGSVVFLTPDRQRHALARYEYDGIGRLVAAYDPLMRADRYEYDAASRLTREILKDGGVFYFLYDNAGRCIKTSGLDRYDERTLRYLEPARWTEVTDSLGNVTRYQYLPTGQVAMQISPLGASWRTEYDEHGRIIARIDPVGGISRCGYDEFGNANLFVNVLGQTTRVAFNGSHQIVGITSPSGSTWQRRYDPANRLVGTTDPLGNRWSLVQDDDGNVVQVRTPRGDVLSQVYDSQGRVKQVRDGAGHVTTFARDVYGRVTGETDPLGRVTAFEYDLLGNPRRIVYPDGSALTCEYDEGGNLTRVVDRNGGVLSYRFGACGRLLAKTERLGNTTTFHWSTEAGQLLRITNAKGEQYRFERDAAGNIVAEIGFDDRRLEFEHDLMGNRTAYVTGANERITYRRDAIGRLIEIVRPDGVSRSFAWDVDGYLASAANADLRVVFERDPKGRILKEHQGDIFVEHEYDSVGNRTVTRTSLGHETRYEFDANRLLARMIVNGAHAFTFHRNARGEETERMLPGDVRVGLRLNDLGQVTEQDAAWLGPMSRLLTKRAYSYLRSAVVAVHDDRWGRTEFSYDASEQLERFAQEWSGTTTLSYDTAGNLCSMGRDGVEEALVYGPGDRLLRKGQVTYTYDDHGRLLTKHDESASSQPTRFAWDSLGQLRSVTCPDQKVWTYHYDPFGRRIRKVGPDKEVHFVWDRDTIIHEIERPRGAPVRQSTWIFNPYNFTPLAKVEGTTVLAAIVDQVGAPRELVDTLTRAVVWSARYGPFGSVEARAGTAECAIRFQGQYHDEESGLYYNRFRYYDPDTGRFVSQDPVRLAGGDNLYAYAPNPWNWIDPFGLASNAIFRGDDDYSGGPMGMPLGSDADIKDPKAHVTRPSKGESSIYTSFSEEHGSDKDGSRSGALKFTEDDNVFKVKRDDLQKLADEGKVKIITHENVGEEMDRIGGFSEKDKKNVAANMKRNKEVLVEGEIPEEMVTKCKK